MSEEQAKNETGGFRFAVTLLAALGCVVYAVYIYFQNTPVDPYWSFFVCALIAVALILVGGLPFYILIKGCSLEVKDPNLKEKLKNSALNIYLWMFVMFIMLLVLVPSFFVLSLIKIKIGYLSMAILLAIAITISLKIGQFFIGNHTEKYTSKSTYIGIRVLVLLFICILLSVAVQWYLLQGHVTVDMESIYYKNDAQIPVLIHITGQNTGLSLSLAKEELNHNLSQIDSIMLKPEHNPDKTVSGKFLVGNALDYGTYTVFINTTYLNAGYYELRYVRTVYKSQGELKKETYGARGFYLLNSSQHSVIEELNAS